MGFYEMISILPSKSPKNLTPSGVTVDSVDPEFLERQPLTIGRQFIIIPLFPRASAARPYDEKLGRQPRAERNPALDEGVLTQPSFFGHWNLIKEDL
jgi:hypothetical protein